MKTNSFRQILGGLIAIGLATANFACSQSGNQSQSQQVGDPKQKADDKKVEKGIRKIGVISDRSITECSGIAISRNFERHFWVHNDSGDSAMAYLLDGKGSTVSKVELEGVRNRDFEDVASFSSNGRNYVAIGDVGNNARRRKQLSIYIFEEPAKESLVPKMKVRPVSTVNFTYEDGVGRDCEAMAYLKTTGQFLVSSKPRAREVIEGKTGELFAIDFDLALQNQECVAKKISEIAGGMITAMDCSPDGNKLVLRNYLYANLWTIKSGKLKEQLTDGRATRMFMPPQIQSEAICFSNDGTFLVTTSEGKQAPLFEIPIK